MKEGDESLIGSSLENLLLVFFFYEDVVCRVQSHSMFLLVSSTRSCSTLAFTCSALNCYCTCHKKAWQQGAVSFYHYYFGLPDTIRPDQLPPPCLNRIRAVASSAAISVTFQFCGGEKNIALKKIPRHKECVCVVYSSVSADSCIHVYVRLRWIG